MKKILIVLIVAIILVATGAYWYLGMRTADVVLPKANENKDISLAPEVEAVLAKEAETLEVLAAKPEFISEIKASNDKNKNLSAAEISRLDSEWQGSKSITPFIQQFLTNKTAQVLLDFQRDHAGFKEIFVADSYGLNVGQTNKTSDYYQADEDWWVDSMNGGEGKVTHGSIEFDQSSQAEAISIYVPVYSPETKRAIGVIKGVLDLSSIKDSL